GTGLGLPTVRSIVENQRGVITLHSRVGHGTTFQVILPASPDAEFTQGTAPGPAAPRGTGELILVVDDDENVRDVTTAMLSRNGYRVLAAANGTEAVALFAPRSLEISVVVTDLNMPELDGFALAKVVRSLNPSTRILAMSGMSDTSDLRRQNIPGPLLTKPFTSEALLVKIRELLTPSVDMR
ncbi:MAG TPA: response regulator, partial [Opitutus sp.]|nr:response regulator [Opitutus sp.]